MAAKDGGRSMLEFGESLLLLEGGSKVDALDRDHDDYWVVDYVCCLLLNSFNGCFVCKIMSTSLAENGFVCQL